MEKPDVDFIEGLSPQSPLNNEALAILAPPSYFYRNLRLSETSLRPCRHPHSPESDARSLSERAMKLSTLMQWPDRSKLILLAPIVSKEKGEFRDVLERLQREGFIRRIDRGDQEPPPAKIKLSRKKSMTLKWS